LNSSLSKKLVVSILLFSAVLTFISVCLQLYFDFNRDLSQLDDQVNDIKVGHLNTLSTALWKLDKGQIDTEINSISSMGNIVQVEIKTRRNTYLAKSNVESKNIKKYQFPMVFESDGKKHELGSLIITMSLDMASENLVDRLLVIIFSQGLKTFIVSMFLLYVFHWMVMRYLIQISDFVKARSLSNLNHKLELNRTENSGDELTTLVHSINSMIAQLNDDMGKLKEANQQIQDKEDYIRQTQKIDSLGQLVGGIAHDFNNILAIIDGNVELLELSHANDSKLIKKTHAIRSAITRAKKLVSQLSTFSRKKVHTVEVLDANSLLSELDELVPKSLTPNVSINWKLEETLWRVKANPEDLQSAILNVVINAKDAMPNGGGIFVVTSNNEIDDEFCQIHPQANAGDYVCITVRDTGVGIAKDDKNKIFDPFFTTKDIGQGTGLGLSMVYGCVKAASGFIVIESQLQKGTAISIYLPRSLDLPIANDRHESIRIEFGTGKILLVDDEVSILDLASQNLREFGYQVVTARSGKEAIRIIEQSSDIDLLLTDILMPEMNGYSLIEAALELNPRLKILTASGYSDVLKDHPLYGVYIQNQLEKPYNRGQLSQSVSAVLGA